MSWRVANACAERKFGSATRKQIIMFLADKASDDGSGIWCSKGTIQRHTELGETTVKRTIRDFLKEGILVETGARTCKNGFTVVYRIDLAKVEALEPTAEPEIETGATVAGVPGPPRPPNPPKWGLHRTTDIESVVWHQDVFKPTSTAFNDLVESTKKYDYAVFCITADDELKYREQDVLAPRDNVIFEAGLFIGALGADRVFLVVSTASGAKVPTDLSGVNLVMWRPQTSANLRSALGPAIVEIKEAIGV
ncbi:TIR domain-containing protein [uncultured Tateyamaria sp.]|uniref:TIR domain-containing protein n=1 Tax=uncultured Tateyamaria sp. TaxID=455651 RepID=UPI002630A0F1|nr:TIR domain-containing protein [uncultured Tateyamaria sp.]